MLYIQKNIQFLELEQELPDSYLVGDNIENYEDGAYLLLSEEQEQYHNDYPEASPLECWYMALTPEPQPTPEELLLIMTPATLPLKLLTKLASLIVVN